MKKFFTLLFLGLTAITYAQETYALADGSTVTVDGTSTIHDWTVTANTLKGTLKAEGANLKNVLFEVEVGSILSERGATMDKKTHNALKKEEHPKVIFTAGELGSSSNGSVDIKGTLNIAGVEKEVTIPSKISNSEGKLKISGEKEIILQDYDIEPPTAMFGSIVVGDEVNVKFDLVFKSL